MHAFPLYQSNTMKPKNLNLLILPALLLSAGTSQAAVISYYDADLNIDGNANDGSTTGWHSTSGVKPGDIDGDNALGTDGWIRAIAGGSRSNPTRFLPGYIVPYADNQANLAIATTSRIGDNTNVYAGTLIDAPAVNASNVAITSGISASNNVNPSTTETQGTFWHRATGGNASIVFAFTMQNVSQLTGETLRVGLLFDAAISSSSSTQLLNITQYSGGSPTVGGASASSPQLAYRSDGLDVAYFDLTELANGDKFVITVDGAGTNGTSHLVGLTFDSAIPEPGAAVIGSLGLLALLRRRRS